MTDFFKFKESLEEAKAKQAKKPSEVREDELEKDDDDPCWDGYVQLGTKMKNGKEVPNCVKNEDAVKEVKERLKKDADDPCQAGWVQLGTKMKNGKEVPNCVPIDEARNRMKNSNVTESKAMELGKKAFKSGKPRAPQSNEKDLEKIGGMTKKNMRDFIRGYDAESLKESKSKSVNESYDAPDYGPAGAADMAHTQLHFIMYAAEDIMNCVRKGCPMPEWYQNKLAKLEGDMEGLYSYMKGKTRKMQAHQSDRYGMMGMGRGMYEETLTEGVKVRHDRYKRTHGKNASGKGTWTFTTRSFGDPSNNEIYMGKSNQSVKDAAKDAAKALGSDEVYVMESAASLSEQAKSGGKEAYQKFFNKALKKFGVDSPAELEGDKEKEFYDYVDKNWKADDEKNESYINEVLKPSDDVSKWIEDFRASDAPQFKGKDKEERREMAVAAWLDARREAGYDVGPNPNE